MDEALQVRLLPHHGPRSWWEDRFRLLYSVCVTALRRAAADAPVLSSATVAYDPSTAASFRDHRRAFARIHFGEEIDFVGRGLERSPGAAPRGPWLRWYALGVATGLRALFDFSGRRYLWLAGLLLDVQAFARALPGLKRVYCFALYDRRPYLLATWLHRHTRVEVLPVFQNIPLYRNCRFLHLEVPIVLTSRVNIPEAEYYRARGTFRATGLLYRSQEFPAATEGLAPSAPVIDIGYFSSGEWARSGGLYQSDDIEAIRRGDFADNGYAVEADRIVRFLAEYVRGRDMTLRIYPHPLERRLHQDHGIEPPYADLDDGEVVTVDFTAGDSRRRIHEPRIAVSLQSSFIWERLDLGLEHSLIFEFAEQDLNVFARESLGPYSRNVFASAEELEARLDEWMADRS